jgi:GntR family transcriptional repressor for pyruvate dehydrogenase complex
MSRLHVGAMRELLEEIAVGEYAPGDLLPREVDLVTRFQLSRGVVRECIRGLEERGVVAVTHGRGARVTEPGSWNVLDPEVLRAMLAAPGGDSLIDEALECQRLLEVDAAGLAAERAGQEELDALTSTVERMEAEAARAARTPAAAQRYLEADAAFHRAVVRAAGNRALTRMTVPLHDALAAAAPAKTSRRGRDKEIAEHHAVIAAIAGGDADAARHAIAEHLGAVRRTAPAR